MGVRGSSGSSSSESVSWSAELMGRLIRRAPARVKSKLWRRFGLGRSMVDPVDGSTLRFQAERPEAVPSDKARMALQQQRYRVIEKIASGGMAEVFRAESA